MGNDILKNKPLVEAIFELRWNHSPSVSSGLIDQHYKLLIGSLYERVKGDYPVHERLDSATMPEEFALHVVQHRFWKGVKEWPLIQIGPGILTLNDTENYIWEDFELRISKLLNALYEVYPDPENIDIVGLILRYIDAIMFDYDKNDIFDFLNNEMKMSVKVYDKLFEDTGVGTTPVKLDLRFSFRSAKPEGTASIRFYKEKKFNEDALFWDTLVADLSGAASPKNQDEIMKWVVEAHALTHDWFFKIIKGDLERRFK